MAEETQESAPHSASLRPELTYDDWTRLLSDHFFHPGRAGNPVTLFVDDDLLGDLEGSRDPEAGVQSLVAAVSTRLRPDSHDRRFTALEQESIRWKVAGGTGPPPALPLLAVAVLAATQMGAADGLATHNYWKRFRNLFGYTADRDLKGYGEDIPPLWEHLRWWLDERHKGELGVSTVRTHPHWRIIGYALSQALFREIDRRRLTEFFQRIDLEPGEQLPRNELLAYFRAWAPQSPLTGTARSMATDEQYADWLADILQEEAAHWDGTVRDERGRRVGRLAVALETFPAPTYWLAAQRPDSFPATAVFASGAAELKVETEAGAWYDEKLPLNDAWLSAGLRLEYEEYVLAYKPSDVVVLGEDTDLGCWVSVTRVEPGTDYRVLIRSDLTPDLREFLAAWDIDGEWHEVVAPGAVPSGWAMFTGVAVRTIPPDAELPASLKALVPSVRERVAFRGGLPLNRALNLYLQGGEPDLWLPSLLEEGEIRVQVGSVELRGLPGQRLELRDAGLPPGTYEVHAGPGEPLHFTTVASLGRFDTEGTGTLGFAIDTARSGPTAAAPGATLVGATRESRVWVRGATLTGDQAAVPQPAETIILPLQAREYVLLGAEPGQVCRPTEPEGRPAWMAGVGDTGLFPCGFEVYPPFPPVWLIVRREQGERVRLRRNLEPSATPANGVSPAQVQDWCDQLETTAPPQDEEASSLWERYRSAAAAACREPTEGRHEATT